MFRYSLAKAYRFPIVEELFQNERRTQGTSLANANLEPEDGLHQNLMFQKDMENGYFRKESYLVISKVLKEKLRRKIYI